MGRVGLATFGVFIFLLPASFSRADDGAIESVGGAVSPITDHPTIRMSAEPDAQHHSYGDYACWYTKEIAFAKGQRRCVRDVYSGLTGSSASNDEWFDYILWSGATWADSIGVADIVFTFDSLPAPIESITATPSAHQTSRNELRWHFVDLEPSRFEAGTIHVSWKRPDPRSN